MIKAISYWSMKEGLSNTHPIDEALVEARNAGFQGMELCIGPDGVLSTETTRTECEAIRSQINACGMVVETVASGMSWSVNPTSNDGATRQHAFDLTNASLERAAWLGCQAMLFVPGVVKSPISPDIVRYDHAMQRAAEIVKRLLETAEKVGVDLCLENVWNGFFYSPLEFNDFIDSFGSNRLGIYFDVGNVLGYHQHPPHWIELMDKRIKRVHVKDYKEEFDWQGTYTFCDLLEGNVPFAESMASLRQIGYDGTIVAEMIPWKEGLLTRTSEAMDKILAM